MPGTQESSLVAIDRVSAKVMVVQRLREAILKGELQAGQRLTEPYLADTLRVGQATIREALIELEHAGFIQRQKPCKTFVTKLTRKDIEYIYSVRIPLEIEVVRLLSEADEPALEAAEQACRRMRAAEEEGDATEFRKQDLEFHRALWTATRNPYLVEILERLVGRLFAFAILRHGPTSREELAERAVLHGRMLERIRARDASAARSRLEATMDKTWVERSLSDGRDGE